MRELLHRRAIVDIAGGELDRHDFIEAIEHQVQLEAEAPAHAGLAARCQALEGLVPADTAIVAQRKCRRVDVIDGGSLSQTAEQKAQQRYQHAWLERHKTLITRHAWKIAAQHVACDSSIKTFQIFEPSVMQHQQNRADFADAQAGLWPAERCRSRSDTLRNAEKRPGKNRPPRRKSP